MATLQSKIKNLITIIIKEPPRQWFKNVQSPRGRQEYEIYQEFTIYVKKGKNR